jgi:hypothetical protein
MTKPAMNSDTTARRALISSWLVILAGNVAGAIWPPDKTSGAFPGAAIYGIGLGLSWFATAFGKRRWPALLALFINALGILFALILGGVFSLRALME